ncbi:LysR family transcriptional regulator [Variovorax boronicumulans]|uniref:LysR family transcriptional regulator n=1 Tax=Variovorax boronicumulans TaxID=436515 RepID=UPI00358E8507
MFTYVSVLYSFSAAADELGISKSSVSRSIVRLETLMGTQLLNRTTRKVKLTRAGNVLKDRGVEIMKRISESVGSKGFLSGMAPVVRAFTELLRASLSTASVSSSALEMPVPSNVDATDAPGIASAVPQPLSSPHEEPRSA